MFKKYHTKEDGSVGKSSAPVALLSTTEENPSPSNAEVGIDLLMTVESD